MLRVRNLYVMDLGALFSKTGIFSRQHNDKLRRGYSYYVVIQASRMWDTHRCVHETSADKQWTIHLALHLRHRPK